LKGVILAGGTGSRLHPLTRITNKHLLPIYDRPMISYAVEALVMAGVTEIMLVTGGTHAGEFLRLLGNGHEYGVDRMLYAYQERPGGIAEALGLTERFVGDDRMVVILADNVVERSIKPSTATAGSARSSKSRSSRPASSR
jgi:glucose-1-phosphate thymidylyltransferase